METALQLHLHFQKKAFKHILNFKHALYKYPALSLSLSLFVFSFNTESES